MSFLIPRRDIFVRSIFFMQLLLRIQWKQGFVLFTLIAARLVNDIHYKLTLRDSSHMCSATPDFVALTCGIVTSFAVFVLAPNLDDVIARIGEYPLPPNY